MHLIDGTDEILDPEGIELAPEAVPRATLAAARDCMAGDVHQGLLKLNYRIEVRDEANSLVHSLPFTEAIVIVPA
jgi:hypothetical protein